MAQARGVGMGPPVKPEGDGGEAVSRSGRRGASRNARSSPLTPPRG